MVTLVERLRQIVAAEDDDFFKADTLLYYLNRSQRKVISEMIKREKQRFFVIQQDGSTQRVDINGSLRALDKLRDEETISADPGDFVLTNGYFVGKIDFPAPLDQFLYLRYKDRIGLRELTVNQLHMLDWGTLRPSPFEGYYYVRKSGSNGSAFECYLHEDPEDAGGNFTLYYVKRPAEIDLTDTEFPDLPEQLENAAIYNAAVMMNVQENVKNPNSSFQEILNVYVEELNRGTY